VALGLDLGLNTGWALVRRGPTYAKPVVLACGNLDVRRVEGLSGRLLGWHAHLCQLAPHTREAGCQGVAYEEIGVQVRGRGFSNVRWIIQQEGILNVACPHDLDLPVVGVNQATLRAFAGLKPKSTSNPSPPSWSARSIDVFKNPDMLRSQDQAVAAFAALWLCETGEKK
jgi:hypothetical protein